MKPESVLERLLQGNRRFASDQSNHPNVNVNRRLELSDGQNPFAIILGCSDSRVPPELIFDCGLGDIFVLRSAGHQVDPVAIKTIEFGVKKLGAPLLMVLGHSQCGAVTVTIDGLRGMSAGESETSTLVEKIRPAVEIASGMDGNLLDNAVRVNVELTVDQIKSSRIISVAVERGRLRILGAFYSLNTGVVELIC